LITFTMHISSLQLLCRDSVGVITNVVKIGYLVTGKKHNFH